MKEKKPPKQIKITHEAYTGLLKIGDESYSMTDRINYLLGEQPKKKIDSIPYAVAQASILANIEETKFINRSEIMKKVPKQLIELGWDKVHPDFFEDLKSWRCPIKVFLDNVIKSLVIKGVIKKHSTDLNYRLHEYLMSANDYLATYKDDSYSIRITLEDVKPFDKIKQLV